MKFICAADLHISDKCPKSRKGNYFEQIIKKFEQILIITKNKTNSKLLTIAGDFFDSPTVPYKVTKTVLNIINKYDLTILVVSGQHDTRYHVSGLDNTPLGILQESGAVKILKNDEVFNFKNVSFIGAGWNEEPKEEADVLVIHRMVTKRGELWPGQTNYSTAHAILRKYPWAKCIISGDNHIPHSLRLSKGEYKLQVNCGSMMRSTKTQIDYQPRCWVIDSANWKAKPIKIGCLPYDAVFDLNQIEIDETKEDAKKEAEEKIAEFINTLPNTEKERPNYKNILNTVIDQIKPKKNVLNIINQTMERIV